MEITIDGQFTPEGVSVTAYGGEQNIVLDETWFTWDEVEERKSNQYSDFTFKLEGEE